MVSGTGFTRLGKAYLWVIIVAGFTVVAASIHELYIEPLDRQWFILAALTLISGSATIRLPSSYASISTSETFVFTAVLLYGPAAGTVVVVLDALVVSFWISKRQDEPHRALFNLAAPALSVWLASHLFFLVAGVSPLVKQPSPINAILPALVLFALTYFTLNSWLITFVIAFERRLKPFAVWKRSFVWLSLNYLGGASVAFLLVGYNRKIDLGYIGVIIPLLLVLYFTFKTAMARVEDSDKHVEQLNRMYLSTIETLAMAIDAKDQVTHGHIRRVQAHAISLAREVGVRDENLLKAIEAAALLHDMGKLAVPEYILNKPGKLTPVEFEKMKLHASVGADILSAIDFPYPVVPIVRHHHENWDGSGYPAGIKGTDIPIGARILSVVDCFDALTSDRPYRPALSNTEALAILRERRGTMYDPIVVDTFFKVHGFAAPEIAKHGPPTEVLNTIGQARRDSLAGQTQTAVAPTRAAADELLNVHDLAKIAATKTATGDIIGAHLQRLIPASLCVIFVYDASRDDLEARYVAGDNGPLFRGTRIGLGQRLSGWVAANHQTICNSDATLDLGTSATSLSRPLRTCLSTPLLLENEMVGVLSLYSVELNGFSDGHKPVIERFACQIARILKSGAQFDGMAAQDMLTGLPNVKELALISNAADGKDRNEGSVFSLIYIDIVDLDAINGTHGRALGDETLLHVVRIINACLRPSDILFRSQSDEFVAVLQDGNAEVAARRIREAIRSAPLRHGAVSIPVNVMTVPAFHPSDGDSFGALLRFARAKLSDSLPQNTQAIS